MDGSSIKVLRCTKYFDNVNGLNKFDQFVDQLFDSSFETRKKICEDLIENIVIDEIDENNQVVLSKFKAPGKFTPREFLVLKSRMICDDGSHLIIFCSINRKRTPFSEGYIRGVGNTGILVTPLYDQNKIKVTKVDHIDPRGKVPSFVLNTLKKKSVENLNKMEHYLQ